jgi:protein-S-isoprenylcysteine O-methyltransferase Ste14
MLALRRMRDTLSVMDDAVRAGAPPATWTRKLARARVPLGFVCGVIVLWFARPEPALLMAGLPIAVAGEALRVWAAGHLEKSREVTQSGPYRFMRHPLYAGSAFMGMGVAIASGSMIVAVLAAVYLFATIRAAVKTEEAFLRSAFGGDYDAYSKGRTTASGPAVMRKFSFERAMRNKEYRAMTGLVIAALLLVAKMWFLRS